MDDIEVNETTHSTPLVVFDIPAGVTFYNLKEQRKRIKEWAKHNLVGKTIKYPYLSVDITSL